MRLRMAHKRVLLTLALVVVLLGARAFAEDLQERPDLDAVFREQGVAGAFALYDVSADRITMVNRERAEQRYVPASTFKIANSLIALETGAVKDESEVIPYGGKPQPSKDWEKDMNMREAIKISNVAIYQEIARRVGTERYHLWLERLDYGNRRTDDALETFWLNGPLTISAVEQVKFIARLAQRRLPASDRAQAIVRDILRLESRNGIVLYGKTGWQVSRSPQIGWWVGWVERNEKVFTFALNIDMVSAEDLPRRLVIGKALLSRLGVL